MQRDRRLSACNRYNSSPLTTRSIEVFDFRDLPAKEEIRPVGERSVHPGVDPDGARRSVQHVQVAAVVGKTGDPPPVRIRDWQRNSLSHLSWRAVQQISASIDPQNRGIDRVQARQDENIYNRADDIFAVFPLLASEGCVHFETATHLGSVQDASLLRIQHIQVGLVGGQSADLRTDPGRERRVKIQALNAFQGIQLTLGFSPERVQFGSIPGFFCLP